MTHKQYGDQPTARLLARRLANFLPGMFLLVLATTRWPTALPTRVLLFLSSLVGGSYMVRSNCAALPASCSSMRTQLHVVNTSSYLAVMRRCPPLGTLWIWACIQLDLAPTLVSLAGVGAFAWYRGLRVFF